MINSLWISKTGMSAQQMQLDVIANNLANLSTNGFKRSTAVFEDLMYQNLRQVGASNTEQSTLPTGLQVGLGVQTVGTSRTFAPGGLQQTGKPLDVAIEGDGFFQVQMPDGSIGYTRDGSFEINATGNLVTSSGLVVIGPVTGLGLPGQTVTIAANGAVSTTINGVTTPGQSITLASFINPPGLIPLGGNLYAQSAASGEPTTGAGGTGGMGTLKQFHVETSNVNAITELVTMIQVQRAYEMNSKAVQTSDQMLQKLAQL